MEELMATTVTRYIELITSQDLHLGLL
jgi:hypothetical protein